MSSFYILEGWSETPISVSADHRLFHFHMPYIFQSKSEVYLQRFCNAHLTKISLSRTQYKYNIRCFSFILFHYV